MGDDSETDEAIAALGRRMAAAITAQEFEEAARLRAQIDALAGVRPGSASLRISRGRPGAMGLGTDQPVPRRAPSWKRPPRPDPMTRAVRGGRPSEPEG